MTVSNNYAVQSYTGNGSTTSFSFLWPVYLTSDVVVYQNVSGVESIVPSSAYSVTAGASGGTVVFNEAPANGVKIAITRQTPLSQETPYKTSSGFDAAVVEHDFDKLVMCLQEASKELDHCIKTGVTSEVDPDELLQQVERVYNSIDNVDTVADNISKVNAVGDNISNVNTVAGYISNVNTTAESILNVNTVAGDISSVNTVAGDISSVNAVAGDLDNIDAAPTHAAHSEIWAEGTDEQVEELGGQHSAEEWARIASISAGISRNIGETICSTVSLEDASLHLADGSLISGSGIYSAFVDAMAERYMEGLYTLYAYVYNDGNDDHIIYTKTTTIEADTVLYNSDGTIYLGADFAIVLSGDDYVIQYSGNDTTYTSADNLELQRYKFFTTEANWQSAVSIYGVCGKYVYDSENNTIRLPKYSDKVWTGGGTANAKGNGKAIGLTNGINEGVMINTAGSYGMLAPSINTLDVNVGTDTQSHNSDYTTWGNKATGLVEDALKSGIVVDLSTITTSMDGYWYIVVATTVKTDIQADIDRIAADLAGKADIDLTNVSNRSGFRKFVKGYKNGSSWYKIFQEYDAETGNPLGLWCEQGGVLESNLSNAQQNVPLLISYKDTNYDIDVCVLYTSGDANGQEYVVKSSITKDDFKILYTGNKKWSARGYIS